MLFASYIIETEAGDKTCGNIILDFKGKIKGPKEMEELVRKIKSATGAMQVIVLNWKYL